MIKKTCFDSNWIKNLHKEIKADPILIEKAIYAFELLGNLVENGLNLVFKGGTSLMLLIPDLKRFSIDLDVITNEDDKKLEEIFNTLMKQRIFNRWEEDKRIPNHKIPKRHYKFYYNSPTQNTESYVLLDILLVEQPFAKTIQMPIIQPFFEVERKVRVRVPTINGLAADKLTAFAPATIGVPYGKDKSMEMLKQLFDLGILFEHIDDLKEIRKTYEKIAKSEAGFRHIKPDIEEFLNDTIGVCFLICQLDFKGAIKDDRTKEIRQGLTAIKSHIFGGKYSLLNAKEDASKIACLAYLIKDNRLDTQLKKLRKNRENTEIIKEVSLTDKFAILDKLKSISPGSFYLWAVANNIL